MVKKKTQKHRLAKKTNIEDGSITKKNKNL
jgi:hypothetical protein